MNSLIDTLYEKRFCLPSNIDVQTDIIENNHIKINSCLCGNYNHIACILDGKNINKKNILSIGCNQNGDIYGNEPGIHAEEEALNKIKPLSYNKKLQNIDLLVIRLSKHKKLQSSKPCANCIQRMKTYPSKKGYRIKHIYYSTQEGNIIKTDLRTLEKEDPHYTMYYKRKRNIHIHNMC